MSRKPVLRVLVGREASPDASSACEFQERGGARHRSRVSPAAAPRRHWRSRRRHRPGAPAVESAPLEPHRPRSRAPGGRDLRERRAGKSLDARAARVRHRVDRRHRDQGRPGGTTIRVNEIYPTSASGSPAKGPFPVLLHDDAVRQGPGRLDCSPFMGGLARPPVQPRSTWGSRPALNTTNPITDTASDSALLSDLAGIEADHVERPGQLSRRLHREHPDRRRRGLRRLLLAGPQPAERPRARRRQPHSRLPDRRRVRHLPERRAGQLRRAAERLGRPERDRADGAGSAHDRPLPVDRRPVGAPQRLLGRRRPARARMVRHLAQARADRHGQDPDAAALLRPRQRAVRRDLDISVHESATPTRLYFGAGGTLTSSAPSATAVAERDALPVSAVPAPACGAGSSTGACLGAVTVTGDERARSATGSASPPGRDERHAHLEPERRSVRTSDRPVVDGRASRSRRGRRGCSRRASATTGSRRRDRGRPATPRRRSLTRRPIAGPITATVYASATTSETELVAELEDVTPSGACVSADRGRAARLAPSRRQQAVLDGSTASPCCPITRTRRPPPSPSLRRRHRVPDPDLPDAGHDRRRRQPAAHARDRRYPAPHAAPRASFPSWPAASTRSSRSGGAPSSLTVERSGSVQGARVAGYVDRVLLEQRRAARRRARAHGSRRGRRRRRRPPGVPAARRGSSRTSGRRARGRESRARAPPSSGRCRCSADTRGTQRSRRRRSCDCRGRRDRSGSIRLDRSR